MIDLNAYGLSTSGTAEDNRQALQTALDNSAFLGDPHVTCAAGTYEIAGEGLHNRCATITGKLNLAVPAGTKFKLGVHPQAYHACGLYTDCPVDVSITNLEIEGGGMDTHHAVLHSYQGTERCRVELTNTKIYNTRYCFKALGGRTSTKLTDNDWTAFVSPYLHTHPMPGGSVDTAYLGATVEVVRGYYRNVESGILQGPGDPNPGVSWRDHCLYINPAFDVTVRDTCFTAAAGHAYQCNGPPVDGFGSLRIIGAVVSSGCGSGVHTHPRHVTEILGGSFMTAGAPIRLRAGGARIVGASLSACNVFTNGKYDFSGGSPPCAILENESMDYAGLYVQDSQIKLTPVTALVWRSRPTRHSWVFQDCDLVQEYETIDDALPGPYQGCVAVRHESDVGNAVTHFSGGRIWLKRGRLFNLSAGHVTGDSSRPVMINRGNHTQASILAPGCTAFVC